MAPNAGGRLRARVSLNAGENGAMVARSMGDRFTFLEFFAGGGMARIGLGARWRCLFANDMDPMKRAAYGANFGLDHHHPGDVHALTIAELPGEPADLAWASSPCQDISLAGAREGLAGERSGAFFGFWRLVEALDDARRAPRLIVVENVTGLLTSNRGEDFAAIARLTAARGYWTSALVLNADHFAPQSRPRLFIVGAKAPPADLFSPVCPGANTATPPALIAAAARLPPDAKRRWRWILQRPRNQRNAALVDILEENAPFDSAHVTERRLAAMSERQRAVVRASAESAERRIGAAFRRIRIENGEKRARIEARFDGVAGCIRTPAGGSSRQIIFEIAGGRVRSRLMTAREAARAMGLADDYVLPSRATAALKLIGDGVAPPVVRWLAATVLEPALSASKAAA